MQTQPREATTRTAKMKEEEAKVFASLNWKSAWKFCFVLSPCCCSCCALVSLRFTKHEPCNSCMPMDSLRPKRRQTLARQVLWRQANSEKESEREACTNQTQQAVSLRLRCASGRDRFGSGCATGTKRALQTCARLECGVNTWNTKRRIKVARKLLVVD